MAHEPPVPESFQVRVTRRANQVAIRLAEMAQERGLTVTQLALLWVKDQPGITAPITGPRTLAHLEDALEIADKTLAEADRPIFDELVHPGNVVSDFHDSSIWHDEGALLRNRSIGVFYESWYSL